MALFVNGGYLSKNSIEEDITYKELDFEHTKRWWQLLIIKFLSAWVYAKKKLLAGVGKNPAINTMWFDGYQKANAIKEGAQSWRALDILYNYVFREEGGDNHRMEDWWAKMANVEAVRNRLKLVSSLLESEILRIAREQEKTKVTIFSIASGSAQAVLNATLAVKRKYDIEVKIILLDLDSDALEYSKRLSKQYGLNGNITTIRGPVKNFDRQVKEKADLVEMVGFLDYRPRDKAIKLLRRIHDYLPSYGSLVTANILHNSEEGFMKNVIDWPMIHRNRGEFEEILRQIFLSFETMTEPHKIHVVGVCYKN
jgi:hypothetical protein